MSRGGLLGGSDRKESTRNAGDPRSIPGLGRCPGEGKGYPLQYSGLENSMDRGAWQGTVHGSQSRMTERPSCHVTLAGGPGQKIAVMQEDSI